MATRSRRPHRCGDERSSGAARAEARRRGRRLPGALLLDAAARRSASSIVAALDDARRRRWPVLSTADGDFLTSDVVDARQRAPACGRASIGSLILDRCSSSSSRFPLGIAAAIYLEEYARDTRLNRLLDHEHPQPRRRARRSCTASSGW